MARAILVYPSDTMTVLGADCSPADPDSGVAVHYLGQPGVAVTDTNATSNEVTVQFTGIFQYAQADISGDAIVAGANITINCANGELVCVTMNDPMTHPFFGVVFAVNGNTTCDIRLGGLPNATHTQFAL